MSIREESRSIEDGRIGEAMFWLGRAQARLGNPEQATELLTEADRNLLAAWGTDHRIYQMAREELASLGR